MRIRSTKPEFWRSARIASVSWDSRLVLKGLESFVDDNGVGRDDLALIVGDLFQRDLVREPSRTLARVSGSIAELHEAGLVWRYEAQGTALLYLSFWESIQRVDKPQSGRMPRPDGTMNYKDSLIRECVASPREDSRTFAPGTGEQGNRGTGSTTATPSERAAGEASEAETLFDDTAVTVEGEVVDDEERSTSTEIDTTKPVTAQTVLGWLIDCCRAAEIDLPKRLIGQYSKEIKNLLDEGQPPQRITAALRLMAEDNILNRPSLLPNKVMTVQTGPERAPRREARSTTDDRVSAWLDLDMGVVA